MVPVVNVTTGKEDEPSMGRVEREVPGKVGVAVLMLMVAGVLVG